MNREMTTTPFGRRPMSHAMLEAQAAARNCPAMQVADKWKLFRTITEARPALGVSDRSLAVLHALLSFHKPAELDSESNLVVFPSNRELSMRAHGMAPVTLRRHLAALVEAGLIIRRDSPNGKRYVRRDQEGDVKTAFGFDLSPLVARAGEIEQFAAAIRAEDLAKRLLRERISLHRRDIAKMIIFAEEQELDGPWSAISERFIPLARPLLRGFDRRGLDVLAAALDDLRWDVEKLLEIHANYRKSNASDVQNERHIQNQNPDSSSEFEPGIEKSQGANGEASWNDDSEPESTKEIDAGVTDQPIPSRNKLTPKAFPLGLILKACPDIVDYALRGIESWPDLVQTANLVRVTLGISPDAWNQAVETFGANEAAIVVAAILQKGEAITSPGGYLRSLTDKARAGSFSSGPLLMGLLKANQKQDEARAG
ncbi:plasmid replication protein RepC [Phyllobacterium bourgognense]|uniref:Replication initiation protein RepC n=1 Tax=Phyllobacterium bourgognense TaxID=314236 RepID=A0A368YQ50_9HYPH|nr:plasmid replication protein RepC [Phyllobacterium bourgognense]RCW82352.1 replication initiation protein RepC [Phyllobacterium bourgognense]